MMSERQMEVKELGTWEEKEMHRDGKNPNKVFTRYVRYCYQETEDGAD